MVIALLAVHPDLRPIVLPTNTETIPGVEIRDLGSLPWTSGWPAVSDATTVITGWGTPPIDEAVLDRLPELRSVLHLGGSVREVVTADVWERGVQVMSAAEANNESVADFVHAQTVLALKGSPRAAAAMRTSGRLPGFAAGPGALNQRVGLLSYGSIASKVRQRLRPLDARVSTWDPFVSEERLIEHDVQRAETLEELFRSSAVLSVHTPLIPGVTEGLITGELLATLPTGATFINTARGALVDEPALIEVMRTRDDLLAILDVTSPEPPNVTSPLYELPNVILTGHTAGSVGTENQRMGTLVWSALAQLADGGPLPGALSREDAALRA